MFQTEFVPLERNAVAMEIDKIRIGNRIKILRKEFKLTQEELALKLGLKGKSSIANYEKGTISPSDDIKLQMSKLFNCSIDYLMGISDVRNSQEINLDKLDIAFATGIKGLNKENQKIAKDIIEGLLAKQKNEENKKGDQ